MFNYFHKNKYFANNKGQLMPLFIVFTVIILIMVIITVNLGKVSLIKTDASNAVDAGALAAASVMANLFNNIAVANAAMEAAYWEFFADSSVMFTIALTELTTAQISGGIGLALAGVAAGGAIAAEVAAASALALAGPAPCAALPLASTAVASMGAAIGSMGGALTNIGVAISSMSLFIVTIYAINVKIIAFSIAQQFFYLSVRKMAEEGHKSAIRTGHQLAFRNSGVSSKLRKALQDILTPINYLRFTNYQETFSFFLRYIVKDFPIYPYIWTDGQLRTHSVTTMVNIEPVDKFMLKVSNFPLPAEIGVLASVLVLANIVTGLLTATETSYAAAEAAYSTALAQYGTAVAKLAIACPNQACCLSPCVLVNPASCGIWAANSALAIAALGLGLASNTTGLLANGVGIGTNTTANLTMIPIYPLIGSAIFGLLPGPTFLSTNNADSIAFIITWIDDVIHTGLVNVGTLQTHQGADFGLWATTYPPIISDSLASFRLPFHGKIHYPDPSHDASLVFVDFNLLGVFETMASILGAIADLYRDAINSLYGTGERAAGQARGVDGDTQNLKSKTSDIIANLERQYLDIRNDLSQGQREFENAGNGIRKKIQDNTTKTKDLEYDLLVSSEQLRNSFLDATKIFEQGREGISLQYENLQARLNIESDKMIDVANMIAGFADIQMQDLNKLEERINKCKQGSTECWPEITKLRTTEVKNGIPQIKN